MYSGGIRVDIAKFERELEKSGRADKLRSLADTPEGRRISAMFDAQAVEDAARRGDADALRDILGRVLNTEDGKRLSALLGEAMK